MVEGFALHFLNFISDKFLKQFFWASHPYVKAKIK